MSKRESDRQAAEARAQSVRDRIAAGMTIMEIMAEDHAKVSMELLDRAKEA